MSNLGVESTSNLGVESTSNLGGGKKQVGT